MGTEEHDSESSDIYILLGLLRSRKKTSGTPRVLSLLSSLLERSIHENETTTSVKDFITIFHGIKAPPLSIRKYIDRIYKYADCSPCCFVVAHIYVNKYLEKNGTRLTSLNVHRLLITSVLVAAKFNDDAYYNNAYYAKIGGVSTVELNRLEIKFLFSLDFRLQISTETFRKHCYRMENEFAESLGIEWPMQVCRIKENWSKKDASTIDC